MAEGLLSCLTTWSHLRDDGRRVAINVHNLIGMPCEDSIISIKITTLLLWLYRIRLVSVLLTFGNWKR